MKTPIKDFYNRIIGFIEDKPNGDQIGYDFYNRIVGNYESKLNVTRNFYNEIVAKGNILTALIWQEEEKNKSKK